MKRRNVRTLSLIVVTFTYLLIGAAVFDALEDPQSVDTLEALRVVKSDIVDKYNISGDDYKLMELLIIERIPHQAGPQWRFAGSFYYALVVLSLIGYGHSTPKTAMGKTFTMGYAMIGIPITMVMFQSMGERMNKAFSIAIKGCRSWRGASRTDATEFDLIVASGISSSIVLTLGAALYHVQEGWTYFDSLYYCFITLSTIGFGDFVALQSGKALQLKPGYVVCSFVFLLLGLAALSSCINLLVLRFMILSLEEDEEELEFQDVTHNVVTTLDDEVVMGGPTGPIAARFYALRQPETVSVCSCTCYGKKRPSITQKKKKKKTSRLWATLLALWARISGNGNLSEEDDGNYYDEETQSISNYKRFAVKRTSF